MLIRFIQIDELKLFMSTYWSLFFRYFKSSPRKGFTVKRVEIMLEVAVIIAVQRRDVRLKVRVFQNHIKNAIL